MRQAELTFADYLRIIRRRRWSIVIVFLSCIIVSLVSQGPTSTQYVSSVKVSVVQRLPMKGGLITYSGLGDYIATQQEVITSSPVAEKAALNLGWIGPATTLSERRLAISNIQGSIDVTRVPRTNFITIRAIAAFPDLAREVAEAVAEAYAQVDLEKKREQVSAARIFIEQTIEKTTQDLEASQKRFAEFQEKEGGRKTLFENLQGEMAKLELRKNILLMRATAEHPQVGIIDEELGLLRKQIRVLHPENVLYLETLRREVDDNMDIVSHLKKKYHDAKIVESEKVSDVTIVDHAKRGTPSPGSDPKARALLGGMIGLILGLVFAYFRENLDTSIGAIEEVEEFLGISVLGSVPHIDQGKKEGKISLWQRFLPRRDKSTDIQSQLVTQFDPRSSEAEAYQMLRANLYSVAGEKNPQVILFTSSGPREGKSLTSSNIAIASAQMGKRTLLVDADMRRPVIHQFFGLDRSPGLFEFVTGAASYEEVLRNVEDIVIGKNPEWDEAFKKRHMAYLNLVTSGHLPSNPPEVLNSAKMLEALETFKREFDLVILDSPPVLPVVDALLLGPKTDGVVLIYQSGRTAREALKRAKIQLDNAKAKVLGVVLNDVRVSEMELGPSYYYRFRKYYSTEEKREDEKKEGR